MSEPHCVHLLEAQCAELLAECHRVGLYLALCGQELTVGELPAWECEDAGCEREIVYCLVCLRAASRWNHEVGVHVDCPPG